jgi:hypothetical protein
MNNPTEKGSSSVPFPGTSPKDPAWIRDVQAATIALVWDSAEKVAELCKGEPYHCEFCGAPFPLWPIQLWAEHCLAAHVSILTLQNQQAMLAFCVAGLTDATKQFLSVQLVSRTTMRRRARDLGMTRFVDEQGRIVEKEPLRIVQ